MTISIRQPETSSMTQSLTAEMIMTARRTAGYTLEQLAIASGLTTAEISAIENGTSSEQGMVRRLVNALQIPTDNLA